MNKIDELKKDITTLDVENAIKLKKLNEELKKIDDPRMPVINSLNSIINHFPGTQHLLKDEVDRRCIEGRKGVLWLKFTTDRLIGAEFTYHSETINIVDEWKDEWYQNKWRRIGNE